MQDIGCPSNILEHVNERAIFALSLPWICVAMIFSLFWKEFILSSFYFGWFLKIGGAVRYLDLLPCQLYNFILNSIDGLCIETALFMQ